MEAVMGYILLILIFVLVVNWVSLPFTLNSIDKTLKEIRDIIKQIK